MLQDPITGAQLGRSPAGGQTAYADRDGQGRVRRPVAGFDLTFSVPKSVSVAWALADPATREVIHAAHRRALRLVIEYAEDRVFASRSGKGGCVQEDVRGVVAAAFDHWDSRAGDPQLHTHVVVMNRVQTLDGVWRTIDSKALFRWTVAMSELYQGVLSDCLTEALGWAWEPRERAHSPVPKWEVAGVSQALMDEFSQRSSVIERATDAAVAAFVAERGRRPTAAEVIGMRQQATLETRPEKDTRTLAELVAGWRTRADRFIGDRQPAWVAGLADRDPVQPLHSAQVGEEMLAEVAKLALSVVAGHRATFTRPNVYAEALRQLHGLRFAGPTERIQVAERVTDLAIGQALRLTPPDIEVLPARLRRPDGTSRLRAQDSEVYSTAEILDAETRLVDASRRTDGVGIDPGLVRAVSAAPLDETGRALSAEQAAAIVHVVTSGRPLDVLVGPAGSGKSTTMAGVRAAWEAQHGVGLGGRAGAVRRGRRGPRRGRRDPDGEHRQMADRTAAATRACRDHRGVECPAVAGQSEPDHPTTPGASLVGVRGDRPLAAPGGAVGHHRRGLDGRHPRSRHHHDPRPTGRGEGALGGGLGPALPRQRGRSVPPARARPRRRRHPARGPPLHPRLGTRRISSAPRGRPRGRQ